MTQRAKELAEQFAMTQRAKELAEQFAKGALPEQSGRAPSTKWCPKCRTAGGARSSKAPRDCKECGNTGTVSVRA